MLCHVLVLIILSLILDIDYYLVWFRDESSSVSCREAFVESPVIIYRPCALVFRPLSRIFSKGEDREKRNEQCRKERKRHRSCDLVSHEIFSFSNIFLWTFFIFSKLKSLYSFLPILSIEINCKKKVGQKNSTIL